MTSQGNGQRRDYVVKASAKNIAVLKKLHFIEAQKGKGQGFVASLRRLDERLKNDPLNFGEPLYRLPALKLIVRQAVLAPIVVTYAVQEEKRLVFIRGFSLLPCSIPPRAVLGKQFHLPA